MLHDGQRRQDTRQAFIVGYEAEVSRRRADVYLAVFAARREIMREFAPDSGSF